MCRCAWLHHGFFLRRYVATVTFVVVVHSDLTDREAKEGLEMYSDVSQSVRVCNKATHPSQSHCTPSKSN